MMGSSQLSKETWLDATSIYKRNTQKLSLAMKQENSLWKWWHLQVWFISRPCGLHLQEHLCYLIYVVKLCPKTKNMLFKSHFVHFQYVTMPNTIPAQHFIDGWVGPVAWGKTSKWYNCVIRNCVFWKRGCHES